MSGMFLPLGLSRVKHVGNFYQVESSDFYDGECESVILVSGATFVADFGFHTNKNTQRTHFLRCSFVTRVKFARLPKRLSYRGRQATTHRWR
jgi:hypothetical protein